MEDAKYSVSWDEYRNSICNGLSGLQQRGEFVDMTLAADGHRVKAHKMILSLVSPYIRDLISSAECPHPIIFLSKVSHQTLQSILEYAYTGEVVVANERIQEFLLACKELRIRGLEENTVDVKSAQQTTLTVMDIQQVSSNIETEPQKVNHSAKSPSLDHDNDSASGYDGVDLDNDSRSSFKGPLSKPTSNINKPDTGLKFTISNMGSAQVVLNRFLYNHRHTRKSGATLWRCCNYTRPASVNQQRCPAFVVLRDNHIVKRACAHNHSFHDDRILRRIRVRNMFTTMTEAQKSVGKKKVIIKESVHKSPNKEQEIEHIDIP